ncbi:MAG: hypothetical protein IJU79_02140 [Desulfovibrionaceae bacterium]|nr:hypothetical protein [Desulfovibrionaceae bacterium]
MDKLLSTKEVAALLELSPRNAENFLIQGGLYPISVSRGRRRTNRWLQSAVIAFLHQLHADAQIPKQKKPAKKQAKKLELRIADMSTNDLYMLTQRNVVQ